MATSTSTMFVKRLQGEVKLLEKNKCDFFQVIQSDTDIRIFYFLLRPRDSSQIDGKAIGVRACLKRLVMYPVGGCCKQQMQLSEESGKGNEMLLN